MNVYLHHAALWTNNLERLKLFYIKYLNASGNELYHNRQTGLKSYFLTFQGGSKLEIMEKESIPENRNDVTDKQHLGLIHLAFAVDSPEEVDRLAILFKKEGIAVLRGPRVTGDGYYEFEALDCDGNRIEIVYQTGV